MPPYSIHTLPQPCAYILYITLSSASQFSFPLLFSNFAFFFPIAAMARLFLLFALVALLPVELVNAGDPFHIRGRVYCDTCRCGFETSATTYIQGIYMQKLTSIINYLLNYSYYSCLFSSVKIRSS